MNFTIYQKQFQSINGNNCHYGYITASAESDEKKERRFSWVYDCGHTDFISQMPDNGKVDLIVLSHFDADHVGGAYKLIQKNRKAICIAPYLDDDTKILILSENIESYIRNDIGMDFINRLFSQNDNDENFNFVGKEINEDFQRIANHIKNCCGADFWTFYPLQYLDPSLKQFQYICNGITSNPKFGSLENILVNLKNKTTATQFAQQLYGEYKKLLHQVFPGKRFSVTANSISVCLYSGPVGSFKDSPVGWLHTGDTNLKNKSWFDTFKNAFDKYKNNIGVISLPHHGAKSSHNPDLFQEWPFAVYVLTDHSVKRADFSIDPLFLLHNRYYSICENLNYDNGNQFFFGNMKCWLNNHAFPLYPRFHNHFPACFICGECN